MAPVMDSRPESIRELGLGAEAYERLASENLIAPPLKTVDEVGHPREAK